MSHLGRSGDQYCAAGNGAVSAVVQRSVAAVCGTLYHSIAAGKGQITVRIDAVTVSVHKERAAGDDDGALGGAAELIPAAGAAHSTTAKAALVIAPCGVETVIAGFQGNVTAGDGDGQTFQALVAFCDGDGTGGNGEPFIRVEAVIAGGDGEAAAAYGCMAVAVDCVIGAVDGEGTAIYQQGARSLDALGAFCGGGGAPVVAAAVAAWPSTHTAAKVVGVLLAVLAAAAAQQLKTAAVDLHEAACADPVLSTGQVEGSVSDIYIAQCGILVVFCMDAVLAGIHGKSAVRDPHGVIGGHAVAGGGNVITAAGDP